MLCPRVWPKDGFGKDKAIENKEESLLEHTEELLKINGGR